MTLTYDKSLMMTREDYNTDLHRHIMLLEMRTFISQIEDRNEKIVLTLSLHDVPYKFIGEILGVSESRISQIYKKAIRRLKRINEIS